MNPPAQKPKASRWGAWSRGPTAVTQIASGLCVLVAMAALTGCAGDARPPEREDAARDGSGVAARGGQALIDAQAALAQCMRRQGIDFPDPRPGRGFELEPGSQQGARLRAAEAKCARYQRAIAEAAPRPSAAERQEELDRTLGFARCMRDQGADVPDPVASSEGGGTAVEVPPGAKTDPEFQRASRKCEALLRSGGR